MRGKCQLVSWECERHVANPKTVSDTAWDCCLFSRVWDAGWSTLDSREWGKRDSLGVRGVSCISGGVVFAARKLLLLGGFCTSQEKRLLQCRVWSWQPLLYNCPQIPSTRLSSGDFSTHHPPSTNTWGECLGNGNPAQQPFKKRWLCLRQAHILPVGWKPCSWMVNGWLFQALIVWAGEPKLRSRPLSFQGQPPQQSA